MPDFLTPTERSARMARIRSKDTSPELAVRRGLHAIGLRFRLDDKRLPGRPDLVLKKHKAVVFVHGCFWHRHAGCKVASTPKSNTAFWQGKFDRNVERDARVERELMAQGWRVFVVWECEVASKRRAGETVSALAAALARLEGSKLAVSGAAVQRCAAVSHRSPGKQGGSRRTLDLHCLAVAAPQERGTET